MKQRFGIAQALIGRPKLIIVDEPTAGLDPEERNRFHNLLSEIGEQVIVILSTHIVEDVRDLCNNMAILQSGSIVLSGEPKQLIQQMEGKIWQKQIEKAELDHYKAELNVISSKLFAGNTFIQVLSDEQPAEGFKLQRATLEDVYFSSIQEIAKMRKEGALC